MATWFSSCVLSLFILLLSLHESPLHASDTLAGNRPLSSDQKLISKRGKFALGFFQPVAGRSTGKWYIGIWYNKIPVQTVVWVANRDRPVSDPTSSRLTISDDGNIVLLMGHFNSPVWSTNIANSTASNSTVAVLLDTGNLVALGHDKSIANAVLWQSFDHFTDTLLPGSKLGRNKVTGVTEQMISWKGYDDPAPGTFTLQMDPDGSNQFILLWNGSTEYWASGNWIVSSFAGVPEMSPPADNNPTSFYTFQFVDNDQETYFRYDVKDDALLTRGVVDVSGQIQALVWVEASQAWQLFFSQPKSKCSVYGACGAYSKCTEDALPSCRCLHGFSEAYPDSWKLGHQTAGCKRDVSLECSSHGSAKAKQDTFYMISSVKLPDEAYVVEAAASIRECRLTCLKNCSCTAYSYNGSCSLWYTDLLNLQGSVEGSKDVFIRVADSDVPDSQMKKWWIVGLIFGGLAVAGIGVTALCFLQRRRRINRLNCANGSLITFRYNDLQFLTKNFSEKLGAGSFGSVSKGVLPDTTAMAVKKLESLRQGEKQFRAEVNTIGNIHHVNLTRLLGFCSEGSKRLLVYEYMSNGSLDRHLFGSSSVSLTWNTRYQLAIGIAKGLAYLHEGCRDCIIHCDIKPQNILLDASFVPKVADFGLAKLLGRDFSRVLTSMRGTVGYLAPEWLSGEAVTAKADVFSYGMMLFEIVSGRRNAEHGGASAEAFFPLLVARELQEGGAQRTLAVAGDANLEELERACKAACWCVQSGPSCRPTMREIVQILEGSVDVGVPPVPWHLQVLAEDAAEHETFFSDEPTS